MLNYYLMNTLKEFVHTYLEWVWILYQVRTIRIYLDLIKKDSVKLYNYVAQFYSFEVMEDILIYLFNFLFLTLCWKCKKIIYLMILLLLLVFMIFLFNLLYPLLHFLKINYIHYTPSVSADILLKMLFSIPNWDLDYLLLINEVHLMTIFLLHYHK